MIRVGKRQKQKLCRKPRKHAVIALTGKVIGRENKKRGLPYEDVSPQPPPPDHQSWILKKTITHSPIPQPYPKTSRVRKGLSRLSSGDILRVMMVERKGWGLRDRELRQSDGFFCK